MGRKKCSVPGCDTKVWISEKKRSMFTASSETMLEAWKDALVQLGVTDFKKTDRICELHFEGTKIERERNIYSSGGNVLQVARKKPVLAPDAVPTIFPTNIPKKLEYAVKLKPEIILKGREVVKNAQKVFEKSSEKYLNSVEINEGIGNDLFSTLLSEVNEQKPLFPFLENWWMGKSLEDKTIELTHWKKDRFVIDKRLLFSSDLKLRVFMGDREIPFSGINHITDRCYLGEILNKFTEVSPCATANDTLRASNCIGYVREEKDCPRRRCIQCTKLLSIELKDLERVNFTAVKRKKRGFIDDSMNLRRKPLELGNKILRLRTIVKYLKMECSKVHEEAVEKAIETLEPSQQNAVRACFQASKVGSLKHMRYTTQWIYECLLLRIESKETYEHLRRHKILILPDINTLNRFKKYRRLLWISKNKRKYFRNDSIKDCNEGTI